MSEQDPFSLLLREWESPAPSPVLDRRVRAAYRAWRRPTFWERLWSFRVTIPVPVLAAALLIAAGLWLERRPAPPQRSAPAEPAAGGYLTRIETAGFQPLPDGDIRVVRSGAKR